MNTTIAAIATPPGEGGIAIIRISGPEALKISNLVFSKDLYAFKSHSAHYGSILNADGAPLDQILILPMHAPRSFTGEDVVEIHCHGGLMASKVLKRILDAGAKMAGPGEFSYRAFQNGKIDLTQAEAIQNLIGSQNELALKNAQRQLEGALQKKINTFQKDLADAAAILEAWVDFPEEGLEFASTHELIETLQTTLTQMQTLKSTFSDGQVIANGLSLCLIGAPNVGKSSLMNLLLGKQRAIVTHLPGTTRDTLEEPLRIGNLHFKLIDTAGMRETDEMIEKQGIERSEKALLTSDLILCVLDNTKELKEIELDLIHKLNPQKTIIVWNKIDVKPDISQTLNFPFIVSLSAKTGQGIEALKATIEKAIWKDGLPPSEDFLLTSQRHHTALSNSIVHLHSVINGLSSNISAEFLASDMRSCLLSLAQICGSDVTEDILSAIFSKFCVGK